MEKTEAMKILKDFHDKSALFSVRTALDTIIPELKESEDEKIRKDITAFFKNFAEHGTWKAIPDVTKWIAWLEKQDEQKSTKEKLQALSDGKQHLGWLEDVDNVIEEEQKPIEWSEEDENMLNEIIGHYSNHEFASFGRPCNKIISWLKSLKDRVQPQPKQGEQKPAGKVEPKFHEGDFILNGDVTDNGKPEILRVLKVCDTWYDVENIYDSRHTIITFKQECSCRVWNTIQDAKDGDVLLSPATPEGDKECPFIFKEIDEDGIVRFHAALLQSEKLKIADGITNVMGYANAGYHIPATKEQREQLEKAIADAGYTFNFEKKELKKVEQKPQRMISAEAKEALYDKPAWSEEDERNIDWLITVCKRIHYKSDPQVAPECALILMDWLKSLRPQNRWKPSDEQMKALKEACDEHWEPDGFDPLYTLYQDLKKLKVE